MFLCLFINVAHIKIIIKITVQSICSNSNPVATDDTNITTIIIVFTGVRMIDDTGESTVGLSAEVIATILVWKLNGAKKHEVCVYFMYYYYTHLQNTKCYEMIQSMSQC